jgi:membrane-associated phospholipid phosphatase
MSRIFCLLVLLSFLKLGAQVSLQKPSDRGWDHFTYDLGNIFGGMAFSYSRPLYWKGKQWSHLGALAGSTAVIYLVDDPISEYFLGIKEGVPRPVRDYGFNIGSPSNNYMLTGAVYLFGLFTDNPKLRRTGVLLISSASTAGLLQQVMKSAIGRARPALGLGKDTFMPLWKGGKDYHSFPSGHTILAFSNAYAVAKQFSNPWVKGGLYFVGLIPGISRLWEGKHWLSDIIFSVGVSIFTVEAIDRYLDKKYDQKYNDGGQALRWNLQLGPGTVGVSLNF